MGGYTTTIVLQFISIMMITIGVGGLRDKNLYNNIIKDTFKNAGVQITFGFIALIFGYLIILKHNIWTGGWPVVVTVVGWLSFIKGILLIGFPDIIKKTSIVFTSKLGPKLPLIELVLGLYVGYFAFLA